MTLVVNAPVFIVPSGVGTLSLTLLSGGLVQVNGTGIQAPVPLIIVVPAGTSTGIDPGTIASFQLSGDAYNAAHDMKIDISVIAGRNVGTIRDMTLNTSNSFSGGVPPVIGIPSGPLVLNGANPSYVDNGSGTFILRFATSGHREGATMQLRFPANQRSNIIMQTTPPLRADVFDFTKEILLFLEYRFGRVIVSNLNDQAADTTAPTITAASFASGSATLTLTASKPITIESLQGLTLPYISGTPRHITGVTGGLGGPGATSAVLTLDGAPAVTDVFSFAADATNTIQDLPGNALAAMSIAATSDFSTIAGLTRWYRGDAVVLSGSNVSQWTDKSGNGRHAVQATTANQPLYNASVSGYNNQPTLFFNNVTGSIMVAADGFTLTQPSTIYCVVDTTSLACFLFDSQTSAGSRQSVHSSSVWYQFAGNDNASTSTIGTKAVFCAVFNGASSALYINSIGTPVLTDNAGTGSLVGVTLGGSVSGGNGNMNGNFAEFGAFSGAHNLATRTQAMSYLGARYAAPVVP